MVGPKAKRVAAAFIRQKYLVSVRRASRALGLAGSTFYYKPKVKNEERLETRMKELVAKHRRFGLPRIHYLLRREGAVANLKKTRRIYRKLALQLGRRKRRAKGPAIIRVPRPKASDVNEVWSFDFVMDQIDNGRRLKCLTIVDDFSKKSPGILADYSITSADLIEYFETLESLPKGLRCDNGPEMSSKDFLDWAYRKGIEVEYIQPGKPIQNAFIESFNSRFREECLNEYVFTDLENAKKRIENWRKHYNEQRPHTAIDFMTPDEFEEKWKKKLTHKD